MRPLSNYDQDSLFSSGFDFNWPVIKAHAGRATVFQSDNDPYVSQGNGEELARQLGVEMSFVPGAGHFNTESGYTEFEGLVGVVKISNN